MNYGHSTRATIDGSAALLPETPAVHAMNEERTDKPATVPFPKSRCDLRIWMEGFCAERGHHSLFSSHSPTTFLLVLPAFLKRIHPQSWYRPSASGTWDRGREAMNSSAGERGVRGEAGLSIHPFSASIPPVFFGYLAE